MDILLRLMNENDWPSVSEIYRQGIETGKSTFQSDIPIYNEWDAAHIQKCRFEVRTFFGGPVPVRAVYAYRARGGG